MRIIVSDSSCLIDIQKGGLLRAFLKLPHELVIPDVLLEGELLSFTKAELALLRSEMKVASLASDGVSKVASVLRRCPYLSVNDGFALLVAEEHEDCIFLTGDKRLRALAESSSIETHGILWVADQMAQHKVASIKVIVEALECWRDDEAVRVPVTELGKLLSKLQGKRS
jgi:predicted nucleic acid-binding protein